MQTKIRHILLVLSLIVPICCLADESAIVITTTSGEKYSFTFAEEPTITPTGNSIVITTNNSQRQPVTVSFASISEIAPLVPEPVKVDTCATPLISMLNGKLHFECATPGAGFHYSITTKAADVSSAYTEGDVEIANPVYTITCYATADGYTQSKTVTKDIEVNPGDVNGDGKLDVTDIPALIKKLLNK